MSVLTVVQDAMELCGFAQPTIVYNSTDAITRNFMALLRVEGDELSKYHGWRTLKVRAALVGTGSDTVFDLPIDFAKFAPGQVFWMQDGLWQPLKQASDEEMLALQSDSVSILRPVWRLYGDQIEFYPAIDLDQQINCEYRSEYWAISDDLTTRKPRFTADSDRFLVPEPVLKLGLVWRFKHAKGFDYAEDFRTYQLHRERYVFNDSPRPILRGSRKLINDGLAAGMYGDIRVIVP